MKTAKPSHPSYRYSNLDAKPLPGDRVRIVGTEITGTVVSKFTGISVVMDWDDGQHRMGAGRIRNLDLVSRA